MPPRSVVGSARSSLYGKGWGLGRACPLCGRWLVSRNPRTGKIAMHNEPKPNMRDPKKGARCRASHRTDDELKSSGELLLYQACQPPR